MLSTMPALEGALSKPTPDRESAWGSHVLGTLVPWKMRCSGKLQNWRMKTALLRRLLATNSASYRGFNNWQEYGDLVRQIHSLHEQLSADVVP